MPSQNLFNLYLLYFLKIYFELIILAIIFLYYFFFSSSQNIWSRDRLVVKRTIKTKERKIDWVERNEGRFSKVVFLFACWNSILHCCHPIPDPPSAGGGQHIVIKFCFVLFYGWLLSGKKYLLRFKPRHKGGSFEFRM